MITKFYLKNFKSFNQQICADLSDIVVTAGSNSCGKSTILQGLLLLAQTLENPNRSVVLDFGGRYIQFSSFRDAVYGRPELDKASFMVGFDTYNSGVDIERIDSKTLIQKLIGSKIRVNANNLPNLEQYSNEYQIRIGFSASRIGEPRIETAEYKKIIGRFVEICYKIERCKGKYQGSYTVKSLKPILEKYSGEEIILIIDKCISDLETNPLDLKKSNKLNVSAKADLLRRRNFDKYQVIVSLFKSFGIDIEDIPEIGKELSKKIKTLIKLIPDECEITEFADLMDKIISFVIKNNIIVKQIDKSDFDHFMLSPLQFRIDTRIPRNYPKQFSEPIREVSQFLRRLQYIGPLRAKPERAYLSLGTPIGIGVSGENAVPVLWLNQNEKISYKNRKTNEVGEQKLAVGVKEWLDEFGIGSTFHITKPKQVIYQAELESSPGSGVMVTIADVGFGVSQLLPVIVAGLKARTGTTLILEQPEIHLHPRLQGKLADFLIYLICLGKKIIVETHSEHLINMLRLRIIQDKTGTLKDRVRILFVKRYEQKSKQINGMISNGSYIETLQVDEYGKIVNWPPDFFPESNNLNEAILKAMMVKFEQKEQEN